MIDEGVFKKNFPKMYEALFGGSQAVSDCLKMAALFIMSYECLRDFITDRFHGFFSDQVNISSGGEITYPETEKLREIRETYKLNFRELGKRLGLHLPSRLSSFNAACAFFHEMEGLNDADILEISRITSVRNELAHNLVKFLLHEDVPNLDSQTLYSPLSLYSNVSNWWIRNIEASIDLEQYAGLTDNDLKAARVMQVDFLSILIHRALKCDDLAVNSNVSGRM